MTSQKKKNSLKEVLENMTDLEGEISQVVIEMQEKIRQLEGLTKFSHILNTSLNPEVVRENALKATCELLQSETGSLFLIDSEKNELYWETALGDAGKELKEKVRLPINDQSIAGYVALSGESSLINDVESDPRHFKKAKQKSSGFKTRNLICVPLKVKEKTIGVLQAINKLDQVPKRDSAYQWPEFTEEDLTLLETLSHQVAIAVENAQLYAKVKRSFYDTVEALAEAIEIKDRYTGGHAKRVAYYSSCIAKHMDMTDEERERIRLGAILHDVGKIGIEDSILKKKAPLDPYEWPVMKRHPELGFQMMNKVESLKDVIDGMKYHHERFDGKGYPDGLAGEDIPMIARIIAVADTYDAMVSTRPYRKGLDPKIAHEEIVKHSGTQFCPIVVEAFQQAFLYEKMGKGTGALRNREKKQKAS